MARYGHLSPVGTDFSEASWAENPELIWQAVVRAAGQPADADPAESASPGREHRPDVTMPAAGRGRALAPWAGRSSIAS